MYTSQDNILTKVDERQLINLTNDDPLATTIDEDKINDAINYAEALINDSLRGRYELPLEQQFEVITDIATNIAIIKLYELRNRTKMPEGLVKLKDDTLKLLQEYSNGKKQLDTGTFATRPGHYYISTREQKFTNSILDCY